MSIDEQQTENNIQSKGLNAPRLTPALIDAAIASEHYFTAAVGSGQVTAEMINRFLLWKLPKDFSPDGGISFKQCGDPEHGPIGTNLFHVEQVREMLEFVLQPDPGHEALKTLTFCVLVLKNGFTVTGESACASPENFNEEIGRDIARKNAREKIWPLEGYLLKQGLFENQA